MLERTFQHSVVARKAEVRQNWTRPDTMPAAAPTSLHYGTRVRLSRSLLPDGRLANSLLCSRGRGRNFACATAACSRCPRAPHTARLLLLAGTDLLLKLQKSFLARQAAAAEVVLEFAAQAAALLVVGHHGRDMGAPSLQEALEKKAEC